MVLSSRLKSRILLMKQPVKLLILIMLVGLFLRIWGAGFGLPYLFHADETHTVNLSASLGYNLLNPKIFWKPAFIYYLTGLGYGLYFLLGKLIGIFPNLNSFKELFVLNPTSFYMIGRVIIGVVFGVLSIPAIYNLGKRFYSQRTGLLSALFLSVSFIHVQNSHYIAHDIPVLFFIILTLNYAYDIFSYGRLKDYLKAGLCLGLAVATKYNAVLVFIAILFAHLFLISKKKPFQVRNIFSMKLVYSILLAGSVFFIINPYIFIDFSSFKETFLDLSHVTGYIGFSHHIRVGIIEGVGIGIFLSGILGFLYITKTGIKKAILLLCFPLLYYVHLVFFSQAHERYALILVPFWIVLAGFFLDNIFSFLQVRCKKVIATFFAVIIIGLIISQTFYKSLYSDWLFSKKDTRILAAEWIERNISPGSNLVVDHTFFKPVIRQSYQQLKEKEVYIADKGLSGAQNDKLDIMLKAYKEDLSPGYNIFYLGDMDEDKNVYIFSEYPKIRTTKKSLSAHDIEYAIITNEGNAKLSPDWLPETSKLIHQISPYRKMPNIDENEYISVTAGPFRDKNLFSRDNNGPLIMIYKIR